jgi:hypothetical protein
MGFPNHSERRGKTSKSTDGEFGCSGNTGRQLFLLDEIAWGNIQLKESPTFLDGIR